MIQKIKWKNSLKAILCLMTVVSFSLPAVAQQKVVERDGQRDFDFEIGT